MTIRNPEIDEDDLRSFLLTFRQFISRSEPIYLRSLVASASQRISNPEASASCRELGKVLRDVMNRSVLNVTIDGQRVEPEYALNLYINGHYFHNDAEARKEFAKRPMALPLIRNQFLETLIEVTQIIIEARDIIRSALREGFIDTATD